MREANCDDCGRPFTRIHGNQRYCGACQVKHGKVLKQPLAPRVCFACEREFLPAESIQIHCSPECRTKTYSERHKKPAAGDVAICRRCFNQFKPKKPGLDLCPSCLVRANNPDPEEDVLTVQPGPCSSCSAVNSDGRGIAICPRLGDRRCAEVNPKHDCRLRTPEELPEAPAESITDTLIRKAGRIIRRQDRDIAEMMAIRAERRTK